MRVRTGQAGYWKLGDPGVTYPVDFVIDISLILLYVTKFLRNKAKLVPLGLSALCDAGSRFTPLPPTGQLNQAGRGGTLCWGSAP